MINREKVVEGLRICSCGVPDACSDCPYDNYPPRICVQHLTKDAFNLLKAQEPYVMTLEEIKDGESYWFTAGEEFVPRPVICVHREDDAQKPYITFVWQFGTFSWESEDYGKTWRCWTSKPTKARKGSEME